MILLAVLSVKPVKRKESARKRKPPEDLFRGDITYSVITKGNLLQVGRASTSRVMKRRKVSSFFF